MVPGSRAIFVIGFERCMTTSLANYLLQSDCCRLLVDGLKEPSVFASEPELAAAIVQRATVRQKEKWLLDASVDSIIDAKTMQRMAQTTDDYRVVICMRNQLERALSAFSLYRALYVQPASRSALYRWPWSQKFGDHALRASAANDPLAPAILRREPVGRYCFTATCAAIWGLTPGDPKLVELDAQVEAFAGSSLGVNIVRELRHLRRTGRFPAVSILSLSYFAWGVEQALRVFDQNRTMVVTLGDEDVRGRLAERMGKFLGVRDLPATLPHANSSREYGGISTEEDRSVAERLLGESFRTDTRRVLELVEAAPQINRSLFSSRALYQ